MNVKTKTRQLAGIKMLISLQPIKISSCCKKHFSSFINPFHLVLESSSLRHFLKKGNVPTNGCDILLVVVVLQVTAVVVLLLLIVIVHDGSNATGTVADQVVYLSSPSPITVSKCGLWSCSSRDIFSESAK